MLYLYTGKPGVGKTLHLISNMKNDPDFKNRKVFVDGIEILDHEALPNEALPEYCNGANWHEWLPDGAILIVDECQRYWRPRPNGSQVPAAIQAMETHRHKGVDIYLITQMPNKIDKSIRDLVEAHKHFSKSPLGFRRVMEWSRVGNPEIKSDVSQALIKPYKLDTSCYSLYKSSVQHNEAKEPKSIVRFLLPIFLLFGIMMLIYGIISIYDVFWGKPEQPKKQAQTAQVQSASSPMIPTTDGMTKGVINAFDNKPKNASEAEVAKSSTLQSTDLLTEQDFEPQIKGQPWTAPAYANLSGKSQIKSMPYPAGCIKMSNSCTCYTEQGTPIEEMSNKQCRDIIAKGLFNPYKTAAELQPEPQNRSYSDTGGYVAQGQVQTLSGQTNLPLFDKGKVDLRGK